VTAGIAIFVCTEYIYYGIACSCFWHHCDGSYCHIGRYGLLLLSSGGTAESLPERKTVGCCSVQ